MNKPFIVLNVGPRSNAPRPWCIEGLPFERVYASTEQQADYIADAMNKAYEAGQRSREPAE